ncbi:hypothetical protein U9M48_006234 [Paspalum notatum var. saurae]|uniref:Retrovirus-related Pol polyprotein from transposon TNT 1-94 n=1 Tax=Paspalum notatum var. saurae TaxID=547442 RepID=A0AAQ3PZD6_PASNO
MNVPKFLWSEAVMTAVYLINRTPSRLLGWKTPYEMLRGTNEFIVPPKAFCGKVRSTSSQVYICGIFIKSKRIHMLVSY